MTAAVYTSAYTPGGICRYIPGIYHPEFSHTRHRDIPASRTPASNHSQAVQKLGKSDELLTSTLRLGNARGSPRTHEPPGVSGLIIPAPGVLLDA